MLSIINAFSLMNRDQSMLLFTANVCERIFMQRKTLFENLKRRVDAHLAWKRLKKPDEPDERQLFF